MFQVEGPLSENISQPTRRKSTRNDKNAFFLQHEKLQKIKIPTIGTEKLYYIRDKCMRNTWTWI